MQDLEDTEVQDRKASCAHPSQRRVLEPSLGRPFWHIATITPAHALPSARREVGRDGEDPGRKNSLPQEEMPSESSQSSGLIWVHFIRTLSAKASKIIGPNSRSDGECYGVYA